MRIEAYSTKGMWGNPERRYWHEDKQSWEKAPSKEHVWNEELQDWIRIKQPDNPKNTEPKLKDNPTK